MNESTTFEDHPDYCSFSSNDSNCDSDNASSTISNDYDESDEEAPTLSLEELLYSASSYHAIIQPVSCTMIFASLASVFINNDASRAFGEEQFAASYNVWQVDHSDSSSNMRNLLASVGNTLIMVCVIGSMTFGIVLLYKYRCMKCLIGYMILSSASLLGLLGEYMSSIAIQIYAIPIDVLSYSILLYNFAIVGVIAIFYQKGIPHSITQIYLVCTSVILAWHLSHFDDWTAWTLLVMLALYDLCAVLTPCGPLKALVNLMQQKDAPDMPGLLYEAHLPKGTNKPGASRNSRASRDARTDANRDADADADVSASASVGTSVNSTNSNPSSIHRNHTNNTQNDDYYPNFTTTTNTPATTPTLTPNVNNIGISDIMIGSSTSHDISTATTTTTTTTATNMNLQSSNDAFIPPTTTSTSTDRINNTQTNRLQLQEQRKLQKQKQQQLLLPTSMEEQEQEQEQNVPQPQTQYVFLPLAIAKIYNLPLVSNYISFGTISSSIKKKTKSTTTSSKKRQTQKQKMRRRKKNTRNKNSNNIYDDEKINESPLLADDNDNYNEYNQSSDDDDDEDNNNHKDNDETINSMEEFYKRKFTIVELTSEVEVKLPLNGGRIEQVNGSQNRFHVIGKNGQVKRELFMNKKGKVFDVTDDDDDEDGDSVYEDDPSSIRLGLGDFIFYSLLVSKAAMHSFTTFAACMLVILSGLGGTLVLLSVYHSALPALPISIFLGVIFYLLTRLIIEPWIEIVLTVPVYV